ncbi:hypothetical protein [Proteus columbae]|uniref:hypothetical protein n=1 Tax=Proteus columbae TaxID=1987580 RepID=UPI0028896579|nr:hypothetical protein [Proteus columbae]
MDWIAGTALVVGMGSLYLTWQSTKAAKKAIETAVEIYEKQKNDFDINNKKNMEFQLQTTSLLVKSPLIIFDSVYEEMRSLLLEVLENKDIFKNLNRYIDLIKTDIGYEVIVWSVTDEKNKSFHIDSIDYNIGLFTDTYYKNANCINEYLLKRCTHLSYLISYGSKFTIGYFISVLSEKSEQRINELFNEETINFFLKDIEKVISLTDDIYFDFTGENIK